MTSSESNSSDIRLEDKYTRYYASKDPQHVYPTEFVVRAFLGTYPTLTFEKAKYAGSRLLDLGCGDGRNMPLFHNLGFEIHGTEITNEICNGTQARMDRLGIKAFVQRGTSASLPFCDAFFDYVVACHSCYYVEPGSSFSKNAAEIARVLRPGGHLIASVPQRDNYYFLNAEELGDGHVRITNDPCGFRVGAVLRRFDSLQDIESALAPRFGNFAFGACDNDFFGIRERVFLCVCSRIG